MSKGYIIIGQIPTSNPKSYGGVTVLTKQLLEYFDENHKEYIFIQANRFEGKFSFVPNYLYIIFTLLANVAHADIIMANVTRNGAFYVSPTVLFITRIFKKRFIFRMFGGNFHRLYERPRYIKRWLIDYVMKNADMLFFELKFEVDYFKKINVHTYWFPNVRKKPTVIRNQEGEYKKRFIFLGHIRHEKGIDEIVDASSMLDESYSIELYGTLIDKKYNELFWKEHPKIHYKGELEPTKVYDVLAKNDVLILPSYWEGYPGVIIEALGVGLPIIATNLTGILEMVVESCAIFIQPRQGRVLAEAMKSINSDNYPSLSKGALEKFNDYEYKSIYRRVIETCERSMP